MRRELMAVDNGLGVFMFSFSCPLALLGDKEARSLTFAPGKPTLDILREAAVVVVVVLFKPLREESVEGKRGLAGVGVPIERRCLAVKADGGGPVVLPLAAPDALLPGCSTRGLLIVRVVVVVVVRVVDVATLPSLPDTSDMADGGRDEPMLVAELRRLTTEDETADLGTAVATLPPVPRTPSFLLIYRKK
jgi:hypothetical protein